MNNPHFIFDMETIGQLTNQAPIVNCAYTVFDWDRFTSNNPYTFDEIIAQTVVDKLDVEFQVKNSGCVIKKSDLDWWKSEGSLAIMQITPSKKLDILPDEFIGNLIDYASKYKPTRWWARSNCFDPVLLERTVFDSEKYTMKDINKVLPFWNLRDTRTYIDTRFNFTLKYNSFCPYEDEKEWDKVFIKHMSNHDIAADILRMQKIEQVVNS